MKRPIMLLIAFCVTIGSTFAQNLTGSLTNGVFALYNFNGNANDSSGNGRNLSLNYDTYITGTGAGDGGVSEGGLDLSQSSHSRADFTLGVSKLTYNYTMSFWVRLNDISRNNPEWFYLFQSAGSSINLQDSGNTFLRIGDNTQLGNFNQKEINFNYSGNALTVPSIGTNQWFNITATQDGNVDSLYFNGNLVANKTVDNASSLDQNNFFIGNSRGYQYSVPGNIDGVVLYNRALSTNEVSNLYNSIPEPSTYVLLGVGALALIVVYRRKIA